MFILHLLQLRLRIHIAFALELESDRMFDPLGKFLFFLRVQLYTILSATFWPSRSDHIPFNPIIHNIATDGKFCSELLDGKFSG